MRTHFMVLSSSELTKNICGAGVDRNRKVFNLVIL